MLQVCFPLEQQAVWLLLPVVAALLFSAWPASRQPLAFSYEKRWVWGALVTCLLLFLAIQTTRLAEMRFSTPREPNRLEVKAREMQARMVEKLDLLRLSNDEKAILATITVNYRLELSRGMRHRFAALGVSHLLSISGFHVAIVGGFLAFLVSFFPRRRVFRWIKFLLLMCAVWTYAFISGLSAPAVRASVMFTVYYAGFALQRRPDKYNTLAATALCMMVYNPFYLFDIGFQLSFTGTYSIVYLQPRLYRLIRVRNPLLAYPWDMLSVTTAAQTGTMPLCCYYFGKTSILCLLTNMYLPLLSFLLIPLALVWMLLPGGLPGAEGLQQVIETLMHSFMWIVDRFSQLPGALVSVKFDFATLVASCGTLIMWMCYTHSRSRWMLFATLSLLLFISGWQILRA